MRVSEVMTTKVQTTTPKTPAADAWEIMRLKGIHHLVVMEGRNTVGIVSSRDAASAGARKNSTVGDLMKSPVVSVESDATVRKAANLMRGRSIGSVPVMERGSLVGIVTIADLLEVIGRGVDRPLPAERRGLHHRVPHRKQHRASGLW
jgi:signal-transduction protein with cAMP-binding, CBS, and nucleotidyltransferase domain